MAENPPEKSKLEKAKEFLEETRRRKETAAPIANPVPAEQEETAPTPASEEDQLLTKLGYSAEEKKAMTPKVIANIVRLNSRPSVEGAAVDQEPQESGDAMPLQESAGQPEPVLTPEEKRLEAEEQNTVDKNIEAMRAAEAVPAPKAPEAAAEPSADREPVLGGKKKRANTRKEANAATVPKSQMEIAFEKAKKKNGGNGPVVKTEGDNKEKRIPESKSETEAYLASEELRKRIKSNIIEKRIENHKEREEMRKSSTLPIPSDIREIYGERLPGSIENIVKLYSKLHGQKREEYVEHLRERDKEFQRIQSIRREKKERMAHLKKLEEEKRQKKGGKRRARQESEKPKVVWQAFNVSEKLKKFDKNLETLYPSGVPTKVLDTYLALRDKQLQGTEEEQRKAAAEAEAFILEQRALTAQLPPASAAAPSSTDEAMINEVKAYAKDKEAAGATESAARLKSIAAQLEQQPEAKADDSLVYEQALNMAKTTYPNGVPASVRSKLNRLKKKGDIEKLEEFKEKLHAGPIHFEATKEVRSKSLPTIEKKNVGKSETRRIERKSVSFGDLENIIREKLSGKAKLIELNLSPGQNGLHLHAELDAGLTGGKITLDGNVVSIRDSIAIEGLSVQARGYVKSMIENNVANLGNVIKTYFEKELGKSITRMDVGQSGLSLELKEPETVTEESVGIGSEETPTSDLTPAEKHAKAEASRSKLRELVSRLGVGAKEKFNWYKSSSEHLVRRSQELDREAEKIGGLENFMRKQGEAYNKLDWKKKLVVGAGLGVGAGLALAAGSLPLFALFGLGIGAQRTAGLMTMYLKLEKAAQDKKIEGFRGTKEWAMLKAMGYTAGMTAGMAYAVDQIGKSQWAEDVSRWLKDTIVGKPERIHISYPQRPEAAGPPISPTAEMPPVQTLETTSAVPATAETVQTPAPVVGEEALAPIRSISVEVAPGRGYEWMVKRVWEQLQEQGLKAENFEPGSDARKLLDADAESIDRIVHLIAAEPNHGYNSDGTSLKVDVGTRMSIDAQGNVTLHTASASPAFGLERVPEVVSHESIGQETEGVPAPPAQEAVDTTPLPPLEEPKLATMADQPAFEGESPAPEAPVPSPEEPAVPEPVPQGEAQSITNQFGLKIPLNEAHIYADMDAKHLMAYGGTVEDRGKAIIEFLKQHPDKVVYAADDSGKMRIPWHVLNGEVVPAGTPMRTSGFFGFFSTFMNPPEPTEFHQIIK